MRKHPGLWAICDIPLSAAELGYDCEVSFPWLHFLSPAGSNPERGFFLERQARDLRPKSVERVKHARGNPRKLDYRVSCWGM